MKKLFILFSAVFALLMVSCSQDSFDLFKNNWHGNTRADGNCELNWSALDTAYFVTNKDVNAYVHFKKLLAESEKCDFSVKEMVPIGLNEKDTLAYLLNFNNGWEIIAADKRAPIVLATGKNENIELSEVPENVMAWIESLEIDVLHLRTSIGKPDWADDKMWDNMLCSIDFWKSINADIDYICRNQPTTRVPKILVPIEFEPHNLEGGHWELVSTTSTALSDSVRLTNTDWSQGDINNLYNRYVPCRTDLPNPYIKTSAGCAAVAGAQMLYYLHRNYGYPESTASHVYCFGDVTNYTMYDYGSSSTIWDKMYVAGETSPGYAADAKDSAAVLIASCGYRLDLEYTNKGGGLRDCDDFKNKLFNTYNIDCSESVTYNVETIKSELLRRMPVILAAYSEDVSFLGIHLHYEGGHVFLIDGYKYTQVQYIYTYEFVPDENMPDPNYPPQVVISYTQPTIYQFGMNWGTNKYRYNRAWYELSGDWEYNEANYQYKREMITGFANMN